MTSGPTDNEDVNLLLDTPGLAGALESTQFKKFLDHVPVAIAVSELRDPEVIVYANTEFERISGVEAAELEHKHWDTLVGGAVDTADGKSLVSFIVDPTDHARVFKIGRDQSTVVELHSNLIENDNGVPTFRLVALIDAVPADPDIETFVARIREKDTQLRELQHRVKNNLQMITALIRMETRNASSGDQAGYKRLAGRVASLALLYETLSASEGNAELDLGVYLSQIAAAVMAAHAVEGITLDLRVDGYSLSLNVAMPIGLVVNELLTNSLKHAFHGREEGKILLHSEVDGDRCKVRIADDGVGLPPNENWPKRGRLGALIADSLRLNAGADIVVESDPAKGTSVTISFKRSFATDGNSPT